MIGFANHCTTKHPFGFPQFLRSKMASQEGNRNDWLWQSLYHKASVWFPLVFAVRRNAALAFGRQSGNRNDCLRQSLYHKPPGKTKPSFLSKPGEPFCLAKGRECCILFLEKPRGRKDGSQNDFFFHRTEADFPVPQHSAAPAGDLSSYLW